MLICEALVKSEVQTGVLVGRQVCRAEPWSSQCGGERWMRRRGGASRNKISDNLILSKCPSTAPFLFKDDKQIDSGSWLEHQTSSLTKDNFTSITKQLQIAGARAAMNQ